MINAEPAVYVASPYGFSEAGRFFYYTTLLPIIKDRGFKILDPWELTPKDIINSAIDFPYGEAKREKWKEVNEIIGSNNVEAIKTADLILAVLDGVDVDSGTAAEIGFGSALGKLILGYRGDFRLSADNDGSMVNLQVEYFIRKSGGTIVTNLNDLRKELIKCQRLLIS